MNEETLFLGALERTGAERKEFLDAACGDNADLRQRVELLLESHEADDPFLRQPVLKQLLEIPDHAANDWTSVQSQSAFDESAPRNALPEILRNELQPSELPASLGRFSHFEILDVLGCGGFGTVLKARDTTLQRLVAIKVPGSEQAISHQGRQRFLREARAAAAVRHENVVVLFAVEEHPIPYLVMELVAGPTLEQEIRRATVFTVSEILRYGIQIADGLSAAHAQGLIHRDIKPSNILIEEPTGRIRITDFGLARAVDDTSLTQANLIAGTPQYMSPEQAEGKLIDKRSDLFSLGSVLYTLCTGQAPFQADSTLAVLRHVCDREPVPIRQLNARLPPFLDSLIQRLHAKQPADRFQSADEVSDLLKQALDELESQGEIRSRLPVRHADVRSDRGNEGQPARSGRSLLLIGSVLCVVLTAFAGWQMRWNAFRHDEDHTSAELAARSNAADQLDRGKITSDVLAAIGNGDPGRAPTELVAVFGQPRFPHAPSVNRHSGIMDISLSADCQYLAAASAVCSLETNQMTSWEFKLWEFRTGRLLRRFDELTAAVRAIDFDPQATRIAIACDDGTLKVVRIEDGAILWDVVANAGRARAVDWNTEGTQIVSGGDHSATVWNADNGEPKAKFQTPNVTVLDVEFSADSQRVLSTDDGRTLIWRVSDGTILTRFPDGAGTMRSATFSHDNRCVVGVNIDSKGYIWNAETGAILRELRGHTDGVLDVEVSKDGHLIATAGLDGTLRLWNFDDAQESHICPGHQQHATSLAITSDGAILVGGDTRGRITLWNTGTGEEISDRHHGAVTSVAFSETGDRLASAGVDGTIRLWNLANGQMDRRIHSTLDAAHCVAFSPDGQLVAASGSEGIQIWNSFNGALLHSLARNTASVVQLNFRKDGTLLASIGDDRSLSLWDVKSGSLVYSLHTSEPGSCLAFSPDGKLIAVGAGSDIRLFEVAAGREVGTIRGHSGPMRSLDFHPSGRLLISSADPDNSGVRIWEIESCQEIQRLEGHIGGAQVCRWRKDGGLAVTCGTTDGTVQLWDLTARQPRRRVLPLMVTNFNTITDLAVSPEGRFLATANGDGTIYILKIARQNEVLRIKD